MSTVDRARKQSPEYEHARRVLRKALEAGYEHTRIVIVMNGMAHETADLRQQLEAAQRRVGELEAALRRAKSFVLKYITHAARKIPDPDSAMAALTDIETALASAKEPQP